MTFIDLFSGIGGFRIALESLGLTCVYSCEKDPKTAQLYEKNFSDNPLGDVTEIDAKTLPNFNILCAGFPCQSFSVAGKQQGFNDTRGTMFFEICRILKEKQPEIVFLENVKNLSTHDKGRTLSVILNNLTELGYKVSYEVLNAKDFGVPQNRERTIIVGMKKTCFNFEKITKTATVLPLRNFLDTDQDFTYLNPTEYTLLETPKKQPKSGLIFTGYRNKTPRQKGITNLDFTLSRVHKQPNRIYSIDGTHPTLSSQEISGRYFILTENGVRKLTINECYRIMGFPETFKKDADISTLYKCIGNSVCVPMITEIAKQILIQYTETK